METPFTFQVNGTQIVGILHSPDVTSGNSPAVLFMHGFTGTKIEPHRLFVKTARALADAGITSLRFDFRGWGDSGGDSEDSNISTMLEDVRAATDFLLTRPGVDRARLGYMGLSTGGAIASLATAQDSRVKTLVLWNPVADGSEVIQVLLSPQRATEMAATGKVDYMGNCVGKQFIHEFLAMQPAKALASRPVPTLLIHSGQDSQVTPFHAEAYQQAMRKTNARFERVLLPDADHTFNSAPWERDVIGRSVAWLTETV